MKLAIALALCLFSTGCATHRYGRLQPLTPLERERLTCDQIEIEISKAQQFLADVSAPTPGGAAIAGFIGDFGIGNEMERSEARKSGTARMDDLLRAKWDKGCPGAIEPPPVAPEAPKPTTVQGQYAKPGRP